MFANFGISCHKQQTGVTKNSDPENSDPETSDSEISDPKNSDHSKLN